MNLRNRIPSEPNKWAIPLGGISLRLAMNEFNPSPEPNLSPECTENARRIQRFLDGESNWDTPELLQHRLSCVQCRNSLRAARVLQEGLKNFPSPRPNPDFTNKVLARVEQESPRSVKTRSSSHIYSRYSWGAFAILGMALSWFLGWFTFNLVLTTQVKHSPIPPTQLAKLSLPQEANTPQPKPLGEKARETRGLFLNVVKNRLGRTQRQADLLAAMTPKKEGEEEANPDMLAETKNGVNRAIEPFTGTARRALEFFNPRPSALPK